ncbi:DNA cytosine methyltransferase [Candidatus Pacearchaeota archaeon]|nr:DNA cytosine methyltransferase [Candidatus Pacearchaeota archaeon]
MRELSLFTGAGGGLLASILLGWRCVGAVEIDSYCCQVLAQRQTEGHLDEFPIWNMDIREFNQRVAPQYQGMVDVITAGFPCQPFSTAGKGLGEADERNMWPATIDALRIVRPEFALLENVPALLAHEYARTIYRDLAESGFDARWRVLSAAELGAPHLRKRLWIVAADANSKQEHTEHSRPDRHCEQQGRPIAGGTEASRQTNGETCYNNVSRHGQTVADSDRKGLEDGTQGHRQAEEDDPQRLRLPAQRHGGWWEVEPDVGRVANEVASRLDRLRALGNGQVPIVAATAWRILT